jgi:hypothetical protein
VGFIPARRKEIKNMLKYMEYIREFSDPLSGTTDIKIDVEGRNELIDRLIDNLSIVVSKRSVKNIKIKSIKGYINKGTFLSRGGYQYDTYLTITFNNKDVVVGEYKSSSHSILIKVNDEIVYDLYHTTFDNEVLVDKIISEYVKYLKNMKFTINEAVVEKENGDRVYDFDNIIRRWHELGLTKQSINDVIRGMLLNKNATFFVLLDYISVNNQRASFEMTSIIKDVSYRHNTILVTTKNNMEGFIDISKPVVVHSDFFREEKKVKKEDRVRWYHKGKLG